MTWHVIPLAPPILAESFLSELDLHGGWGWGWGGHWWGLHSTRLLVVWTRPVIRHLVAVVLVLGFLKTATVAVMELLITDLVGCVTTIAIITVMRLLA